MAVSTLTVNKTPAGAQDIDWDTNGSGSQTSVPLSNGSFQIIERVNADHIPVTAGTRNKTDAAGTTLTETSVDEVLQQLLTDNAAQGIPDNSTLEVSGGVLRVKDAGITAAKIATGAVGSDELASGSVIAAKIGALAVEAAAIAANAVTTTKILDDAVTSDKIADATIVNGNIANATIKAAKFANVPTHYIASVASFSSAATGTASFATTTALSGMVAGTDFVLCNIRSAGTGPTAITSVAITSGTQITVTTNANQSSGTTVFDYVIYRPVTA